MIEGLSIENFKGVRERIEVEVRPITLLFGPNSAGKSTVFHALHYAHEIFERHNLNPDQTISGGTYVDLGGFQTFVHDRDSRRVVKLGFKVRLEENDAPWRGPFEAIQDYLEFSSWTDAFFDIFGYFEELEAIVAIAWSEDHQKPYVTSYELTCNGEQLAEVASDPEGRRITLRLNSTHSSLFPIKEYMSEEPDETNGYRHVSEVFADPDATCLDLCLSSFREFCQTTGDGSFFLEGIRDALPNHKMNLPIALRDSSDWQDDERFPNYSAGYHFATEMIEAIGQIILGPLREVHDFVSRFRYLGPLRDPPPRNHDTPRFPDPSRWASGLAAWDELQNGPDSFVESVGAWLGDEDKLDSGYRVERRRYKEVDLANPLLLKFITGRAFDEANEDERLKFVDLPTKSKVVIVSTKNDKIELSPNDVGIGISQVVPVIAAVLSGKRRHLAIEQPELHLHPKLQAELADLFIEAALGKSNHIVFLETHSELIPLRMMRRIRESQKNELPAGYASISSKDVGIIYIESHNGATIVTPLELGADGRLLDPWPDGFFEEGFRERFGE